MPAHALSLSHVTLDVQRRDVTGRTGTLRVLDGCSLDVAAGESLTIVGPSACGKSTLLDVLAGFAHPVAGEAYADGTPITRPALDNGFVAPAYGLFPWRTALANVTFALGSGGTPEAREARALDALDVVGLIDVAESPVSELDAAQKVRVSIAKTLAHDPGVLLLDDPFAGLDQADRRLLQDDIIRIQRDAGVTLVLATSSLDEAVRIGDRVAVLTPHPGRVDVVVEVDRRQHLAAAHRVWTALQAAATEELRAA
ncbi:ATP-binding cassette domain-containing protein [Ammonicoccus fulvus]|uniref:ATP-binding cassette domain-containing protein n=1 Tax=Ammonicoccus fulvus TaxID=3138240 RepID=A0ABZ3FSJ5_9ACTN